MNALATNLMERVQEIDIRANIEGFVRTHRSQQNIPKIVLDHAIFKMTQEKEGKTVNPFHRIQKQIAAILEPHSEPIGQLQEKLIFEDDDTLQVLSQQPSNAQNFNQNASMPSEFELRL